MTLQPNLPPDLAPLPESAAARAMRDREKRPALYKSSQPTHPLSGRPTRYLTAVNWVKVDAKYDLETARATLDAWRVLKEPATGYVSWDDLSAKTGRDVLAIVQTLKALQQHYPEAVSFSINRMGDGVYVKLKPESLPMAAPNQNLRSEQNLPSSNEPELD